MTAKPNDAVANSFNKISITKKQTTEEAVCITILTRPLVIRSFKWLILLNLFAMSPAECHSKKLASRLNIFLATYKPSV